jgi:hypothetical protein
MGMSNLKRRLAATEDLLQQFCDAIEPKKKPSFRDSLSPRQQEKLDREVLEWIEFSKQPIQIIDDGYDR